MHPRSPLRGLPYAPVRRILAMMSESPIANRSSHPFSVWVAPLAWVVLLVLGVYFFDALATVALGVLAACIIACTLAPLMDHIPGPRSSDVAVLGIGLLLGLGLVVFSLYLPLHRPISDAVARWPQTRLAVDQTLKVWSDRMGLPQTLTVNHLLKGLGDFLAGKGGEAIFSRSADVFLGLLLSLTFTLIGSIFLLSEPPERLIKPALRFFSARHRPTLQAVLSELAPRFRRWVLGTLAGMFVVFIASAIGYKIVGVEFAIPLALMAGFAEIIPTVGPATACIVAGLFALATQTTGVALGVLAVYCVIQAIEAYAILPTIMRGAVNMHPAVTLFSVVLWGKVFGIPGLMLAIPINLTIGTFLEHFRIRPREKLEGGQVAAPEGR
jgi:predicted PurR-regulated permease PerM